MRSSSFSRVVLAGLGVSVFIAAACGGSPSEPSGVKARLTWLSISPQDGASLGATVARIQGEGFKSGTTVTVDGNRVDATVLDANTISLVMPAHAAGKVDVAVTRAPGQTPVSVRGGYTYVGPPVISELLPNIGSTGGGTTITIRFPGACCDAFTVTFDGSVRTFESGWPENEIYLTTPAHAAGTVEVIVTDQYGQSGSGTFTYASPATFDFNGDWQGWTDDFDGTPVVLTIRDNMVVSVSCGGVQSLTLDPPPVVADGEFSFAGSGGVSITGKILSPRSAAGTVNMASCVNRRWSAEKPK